MINHSQSMTSNNTKDNLLALCAIFAHIGKWQGVKSGKKRIILLYSFGSAGCIWYPGPKPENFRAAFPIGRPGWEILFEEALGARTCSTQKCLDSWYRVRETSFSYFVWIPLWLLKVVVENNCFVSPKEGTRDVFWVVIWEQGLGHPQCLYPRN